MAVEALPQRGIRPVLGPTPLDTLRKALTGEEWTSREERIPTLANFLWRAKHSILAVSADPSPHVFNELNTPLRALLVERGVTIELTGFLTIRVLDLPKKQKLHYKPPLQTLLCLPQR